MRWLRWFMLRGGLALLACAPAARADDVTSAEARAVYDEGTRAFDRGDFETAARAYARADEILPSPTALRAALDAAVDAHDANLAMTLTLRASSRPADADLATSVEKARRAFALSMGVIIATCRTSSCSVLIDQARSVANAPTIVQVGSHSVHIEDGGDSAEGVFVVKPDARVGIALEPPKRVSPAWFLTSAGLTVASGVATTIFGVDALNQHASFVASGCPHMPTCAPAAQSGFDAQVRTNVTLGVTIGLTLLTAVTLWFLVRSHGPALRVAPPT